MVRIQFSPPASRANSEFFPRAGCRRPISRAIRKHPETEHADYMERHGRVRWNEIAALIEAGPKCPKLQSYWHFDRYGYQKVERCCTEPDRWSVKALYRVSTEPTQLVSIWLTADRIRQGPLVRIHLPPAVSQANFRIAPLARPDLAPAPRRQGGRRLRAFRAARRRRPGTCRIHPT